VKPKKKNKKRAHDLSSDDDFDSRGSQDGPKVTTSVSILVSVLVTVSMA